jgi:RNA polymerase sigma-70 factor (ECF subfamily)
MGLSPNAPDEIDDALAVLPSLQRAALVLHYMDDLSVRDVARVIGKSEAATASLLARGRDAFRKAYAEADR